MINDNIAPYPDSTRSLGRAYMSSLMPSALLTTHEAMLVSASYVDILLCTND